MKEDVVLGYLVPKLKVWLSMLEFTASKIPNLLAIMPEKLPIHSIDPDPDEESGVHYVIKYDGVRLVMFHKDFDEILIYGE